MLTDTILKFMAANGLTVGEVDGTDHYDPAERLLADMTPEEQMERVEFYLENCTEPF